MEAGKRAPHTQTPRRSATGQVPAFHLAALLRVRRWSRWSRLYGVWVPGAAQPSRWLLRTIWLGYAIQFARRPPKFRGIHLTVVKAADAHVLWEESLSYWRRTWCISAQVLPFGLSLSPRVFTKVAEAALVPLIEQGVRILNYLDDWRILAQSQDQLCEHRDWCSRTSASWAFGSTGKRANSCRWGSLFSVWSLDSVNQTAHLMQERAQSVLNCLNTAGRGAFVSMHFPQWAFSNRHCARSGRKRSRSSSWHQTGPPGLGSQSWCSSWQPLPGRFLWGRIYWLRDGAPYGTRVQTSGNFMSGPWTGRGGSRWPTPRGSWHHHFGESTVYETRLRLEVEPVRRMVLFSQRRPPEMPDQSRAVLLAARVGVKAVSLHPQGLRGRNCCQPRPCGREVVGEAWLGRQARWALADSRAQVSLNENSAPACTGLH